MAVGLKRTTPLLKSPHPTDPFLYRDFCCQILPISTYRCRPCIRCRQQEACEFDSRCTWHCLHHTHLQVQVAICKLSKDNSSSGGIFKTVKILRDDDVREESTPSLPFPFLMALFRKTFQTVAPPGLAIPSLVCRISASRDLTASSRSMIFLKTS